MSLSLRPGADAKASDFGSYRIPIKNTLYQHYLCGGRSDRQQLWPGPVGQQSVQVERRRLGDRRGDDGQHRPI